MSSYPFDQFQGPALSHLRENGARRCRSQSCGERLFSPTRRARGDAHVHRRFMDQNFA